jgi:hypothetical protein
MLINLLGQTLTGFARICRLLWKLRMTKMANLHFFFGFCSETCKSSQEWRLKLIQRRKNLDTTRDVPRLLTFDKMILQETKLLNEKLPQLNSKRHFTFAPPY